MRRLAVVAVVVSACAEPLPKPLAQPPPRVRLEPVDHTSVVRTVRASGLLAPKQELSLAFKIGGVLAGVYVEEGAKVKKGQLLAKLDPTEVAAGVRQAREGHAKALRDYARL